MKFLFWIVAIPLVVLAALFAVANRALVTVDLWPLPDRFRLPLFAALALAVYLGFLFGALAAWWSGRRARARAREAARRNDRLERENAALQARLETSGSKPPPGLAVAPPALAAGPQPPSA
ncbi:MAG: lipopolysaccharide assembly protein LapA domain-containing protein [Pseudomonadota bacterium]